MELLSARIYERWAYAKKGGTAEIFRPFEVRAFFIYKNYYMEGFILWQ